MKIILLAIILTTQAFAADLTTFNDFGGKEGLVKVVDDMMLNMLSDKKTQEFFAKGNQVRTKEKLVEQFCEQLEGPCAYTGQNMKRAHKGHEISTSHFYAVVESLQKAMVKNNIPQRAQNKLLAKLASMHKDIINK